MPSAPSDPGPLADNAEWPIGTTLAAFCPIPVDKDDLKRNQFKRWPCRLIALDSPIHAKPGKTVSVWYDRSTLLLDRFLFQPVGYQAVKLRFPHLKNRGSA
jgi:hypothetical protein